MLGWFDIDRSFDALDDFRRAVDRAFEEATRDPARGGERCGCWPRATLSDQGEALVLEAGLPGVKLDDIEINASADTLTLSGRRKVQAPEGYTPHRQERSGLSFRRSFALPAKVELDKAEATLKDGILTVRLPKAPELKPRAVTVRAG